MHLLLVEGPEQTRRSLGANLRRAGYAVTQVTGAQEGWLVARDGTFDLVILDLTRQGTDAMEILKRLRAERSALWTILLTQPSAEARVQGLRAGADDCLARPFAFEELLARIQSLCRRAYRTSPVQYTIGDLIIDRRTREVRRGGKLLKLPRRVYALLEYSFQSREVVTRTEIESHVHEGAEPLMSNVVDRMVYLLRRGIQPPGTTPLIHTKRGMGYILCAES